MIAKIGEPRELPGPRGQALLEQWRAHEAQTLTYQAPVVWDHASGVTVTDVDGHQYLDWTSGVLVTNVGHSHPRHVAAVQAAVGRLMNSYDFLTPSRAELAARLVEVAPPHLDRVFMLTTGAEATEAAMRIAKRSTGNFEVVSFHGGFHGRTYGAMSVAGMRSTKRQYGPVMPGVIRVPYAYCYRCPLALRPETCDFACLDLAAGAVDAASTGQLAAAIVEPYQGSAGFVFPPDGYLTRLEAWVRERGMIFILDEVQSSFGRTGKMFALEWEGVRPQIVTVGKGIGSGIPTSAVLAESAVIGALGEGELSSTSGGNPVSCAAALAVLDVLRDEGLAENARRVGAVLKERLLGIQQHCPWLGDVRGRGLALGLEFVEDKATKVPAPALTRRVVNEAARHGLLIGCVGLFGNVVRVAPPLTITEAQAHQSADIFEHVLSRVAA